MAKRASPETQQNTLKGNFVSEWFGHRVYPTISSGAGPLEDQISCRCPFLSVATAEPRRCIKDESSLGICTISSPSNGRRQDWLVCPYRAIDQRLLDAVVQRLYGLKRDRPVLIVPAPSLAAERVRKQITNAARKTGAAFVFFESKLGGELSVPATDRSPELAFDFTLVPVLAPDAKELKLGRHAILEIQTMDFHGSYRAVSKNLRDALRLHKKSFHQVLAFNSAWLSERIEGPNIANVFKRTFYQMALKFQIGADESSSGCVLAIPEAVWDSWQRHLGRPELEQQRDGTFSLWPPSGRPSGRVPAWIYVFDVPSAQRCSPARLNVTKVIATSAEAISHYAIQVAPRYAVAGVGEADAFVNTIRRRLRLYWPELAAADLRK